MQTPPGGRGCAPPSPAWALHGFRQALVPSGLPATLEQAFGPKQSAHASGLRLQPLGQAGSSSPPGCRDPAEITRGSWCPSSPFAFQGPAKTCRSEHEPPGQDWNLNIHELPGYNQHPRCTGQMDTWEGRRESEGLTLQVRGAPNHHESWR